jgi:hypothetical protein
VTDLALLLDALHRGEPDAAEALLDRSMPICARSPARKWR